MKKYNSGSAVIGILATLGCIIGLGLILAFGYMHYSNNEIRLRNAISAKQKDNESELDNLQKKIAQNAQIPQEQMKALKDVVVGYAQARNGGGGGGSFVNAVHEAIPNVDQSTFKQLMNIITSSRDAFTMRQKEILDMGREHDNALTVAPSSWVCGGRPKIDIVIVTSTRAKESFATGKDDDISVFGKN